MLKSLQLVGFKSFAEKTRLEFPAGVTAIVGPNGSGKSNVVDAVRWVLGSQSPRSLRGKEMTDVIFNGAESRGSAAMAEVTLAFDNPPAVDGRPRLFDLDESEVRLTRRVYRSGEGQYLVNGHVCRLRDFHELLAGTGAGADSYSIIEQGRVDAALRASPLERRLLLEEAAGVSRFRLKKKEAAKRLARVEQNLLRLSDIVDEVEGRLRRVRSQAGKARRYREASLRLKEARTELATAEWADLDAERRRLAEQGAENKRRLAAAREGLADQESRIARAEEASTTDEQAERATREARQRVVRCEKQLAVTRASLLRAEERLGAELAALATAQGAAKEASKSSGSQQAVAAAVAAAEEYDASVVDATQRVAEAQRRLDELSRQHAHVTSWQNRRSKLLQRIDTSQGAVNERLAGLKEVRDGLAEQHAASARSEADANEQLAAMVAGRDAAADELVRLDRSIAEAQKALAEDRRSLAAVQQANAAGRERLVALRMQLEAIAKEQRRLEQLNEDVGRLLGAASDGGRAPLRVRGLVADLIHVEEDFVDMVEALLGHHAEQVVVDGRSDLLSALLAGSTAGEALSVRATFRGVDTVVAPSSLDRVDLSAEAGVLGPAADFVEAEPQFASLLRQLFGRTWFVDTLATAKRLSEAVGPGLAFVTLDGDVMSADGAVTTGPRDSADRSLSRRNEASRLQREVEGAEAAVKQSEADSARYVERVEAGETAVSTRQGEAATQRGKLAEQAQHAAALQERVRHANSSRERLGRQLTDIAEQAERLLRRRQVLIGRAQTVANATIASEALEGGEERLRAVESQLATERGRLAELQTAASRHREILDSLRSESSITGGAPKGSADQVRETEQSVAEAVRERSTAMIDVLRLSSRHALASLTSERANRELRQSLAARRAAERIRADLAGAVAITRREVDELTQRGNEIELTSQRVELESRTLQQRLRDDYGLEIAAAHASDVTELSPEERTRLREEIDTLKAEVQGVGSVNLESLEELDELENRFEQLSAQYNDLSEAKKALARLTVRINTDSRELFVATFESVRGHFRELFVRLFGGGEADLILLDGEGDEGGDPLEAGVDIVACPPGKELRSLSLMSGGEKTLTCVALLLALFRSRPSPFCLLDEVDAALDEANVGRFLDLLRDFHASTQFVVITHSKRTMAGADTLYGVTMQESGVSKQMAVRFDDVSENGQIQLRRGRQDRGEAENLPRAA